MKYLKEVAIIFGITMAGGISQLPASASRARRGLRVIYPSSSAVRRDPEGGGCVGSRRFFLDTMPLMFIPAGVGLLNSVDEAKSILVPLTVISVVSTVFCHGGDRQSGSEYYPGTKEA